MSDTVELLREVPLFASLDGDDLTAVAAMTERHRYTPGETIVREGEPGDALHVIGDGHARVLVRGRPRRDLDRGDAFGEIALLDGGPRSASVYAVTEVETVTVPALAFAALRRDRPVLDRALLIGLCQRLRGLEDDHWVADEEMHLRDMQATFLANASHELRTPLTVAVGRVELARHLIEIAPERVGESLEAADAALAALRQLVGDLVEMTGQDTRSSELEVTRYPVHGLVTAARELADVPEERLEVRVPPELSVEVDGARITRALAAVLHNAARFGPADGLITVAAADGVTIDVSDEGGGIDADSRDSIFDPFTQRDPSATRQHGGLGIGLSLARSFARLHGGDLTLVEDAPTTTFRLSLPERPRARS